MNDYHNSLVCVSINGESSGCYFLLGGRIRIISVIIGGSQRQLVTSFNTNKPSYASKLSEKPPTNVTETCTDNRKYPDEQTLYISGTTDDDILSPSVLQKRRLYTHFPSIKRDSTSTNKLGKILLLFNNKDCCTRVKNKWCPNLLGTFTRVFSPNESRSHRGIIRDVLVEFSNGDIKSV